MKKREYRAHYAQFPTCPSQPADIDHVIGAPSPRVCTLLAGAENESLEPSRARYASRTLRK